MTHQRCEETSIKHNFFLNTSTLITASVPVSLSLISLFSYNTNWFAYSLTCAIYSRYPFPYVTLLYIFFTYLSRQMFPFPFLLFVSFFLSLSLLSLLPFRYAFFSRERTHACLNDAYQPACVS